MNTGGAGERGRQAQQEFGVAATAAPAFKKLSLELGGKNPTLVFADCDFDAALEGEPGNKQYLQLAGFVYYRASRLEDAARCYRRLIDLEPNAQQFRDMLVRIEQELEVDEAP